MIFYGAIGVVAGGRLGYMLFYNFDIFLSNPKK
jgi:phosphatidylglycerol:prolipoprotein diacylglycerol transferase